MLETSLYARDLDAAERFYGEVLGLERIAKVEGRHVFFRCGPAVLLIFNPDTTSRVPTYVGGRAVPLHGAEGAGHAAFAVAAEALERWKRRLAERGVPVESEVDWPGGGRSLYLRDPAGNSIELATPAVWGLAR